MKKLQILGNQRVQVGHHIVVPDEATGPALGVEGVLPTTWPRLLTPALAKAALAISRQQNAEVCDCAACAVLPKRGNDG